MSNKVSLRRDISYDNSEDQIVGPFGKANLACMRGIFPSSKDKKYLFPFWFGYDTKMKAQLLLENIMRLQSKGYHVVCITADNYTDNVKLAEELGCTDDKPYFLNPGPEHKGDRIYFFFDGVHLMKLMRSHFIDQGKYYYLITCEYFQLFFSVIYQGYRK